MVPVERLVDLYHKSRARDSKNGEVARGVVFGGPLWGILARGANTSLGLAGGTLAKSWRRPAQEL